MCSFVVAFEFEFANFDDDIAFTLDFSSMGKGAAWVNGEMIGAIMWSALVYRWMLLTRHSEVLRSFVVAF